MTMEKPTAPSCERNQQPILQVFKEYLSDVTEFFEIGSGTGQHAVYMAGHFPRLRWQTSELPDKHAGINLWIDEAEASNILRPVELDVTASRWPITSTQVAYTANTLHIVSWRAVELMFAGVAKVLVDGGLFFTYGPFKYGGEFTSVGNAEFDRTLKSRDPASGIRDFEALERLAASVNMNLLRDVDMPSNNRILIWQKSK